MYNSVTEDSGRANLMVRYEVEVAVTVLSIGIGHDDAREHVLAVKAVGHGDGHG
jgi:hypothetical protein